LVEAIKIIKEESPSFLEKYRFFFIGEGPELDDNKKYINENNLADYIKIVRPSDEDWKFMKAFDFFVLPSVKEGLPYAILEAGLAQVPVISTEVGGIPEIITNKENGYLVAPANPLSLKNTIVELSNNPTLAQSLDEKNYTNIKENFSLTKTTEATEKLYLKKNTPSVPWTSPPNLGGEKEGVFFIDYYSITFKYFVNSLATAGSVLAILFI
ncbi:MAG: hypothetical protein QG603_776, partial [Patescibacteria group bacterium]|nr:hypothetical protein [Patescibacteria group bacterium]